MASLENTERFVWGSATRIDALGSNQLWGWSPARDLLETLPESAKGGGADEPINVLLASSGDVRSILRTVSQRRSSEDKRTRPVTFYVHEKTVEQLARHLLLLRVATDWELPLRQRCACWLEIYGNAKVQLRTEAYVSRLAEELAGFIGGDDNEAPLADLVDLSKLKFRDRDRMGATVEAWRSRHEGLDMGALWERRVRHLLGDRYDARQGTFDWDYRYGLKDSGGDADLVHLKQYKRWRDTGIAFEFGDQVYEAPNRTLGTRFRGADIPWRRSRGDAAAAT